MSVTHTLTNSAGTVSFSGLSSAWPGGATPVFKRYGAQTKCIPSWNGVSVIPGNAVNVDAGFSVTDGSVKLHIPYLTQNQYISLYNMFSVMGFVLWTNGNDGSVHHCYWAPGNSFDPKPIPGTPLDGDIMTGIGVIYTCDIILNLLD